MTAATPGCASPPARSPAGTSASSPPSPRAPSRPGPGRDVSAETLCGPDRLAGPALHRAVGDGADELDDVQLVLVGVQDREPADRGGERGALADVGIDGHRVAGASVGAGEGLAACGRELDQAGGDQVSARDDLHVAELPDVVVL